VDLASHRVTTGTARTAGSRTCNDASSCRLSTATFVPVAEAEWMICMDLGTTVVVALLVFRRVVNVLT
jgi:hypothetical protein